MLQIENITLLSCETHGMVNEKNLIADKLTLYILSAAKLSIPIACQQGQFTNYACHLRAPDNYTSLGSFSRETRKNADSKYAVSVIYKNPIFSRYLCFNYHHGITVISW